VVVADETGAAEILACIVELASGQYDELSETMAL